MAVSSSTSVFTWPQQQINSPSTYIVSVAVTDNGTTPLSATNTYTVSVREVNVPPSLPTISTEIVNELTLLTVTNTATNANIHSTITGYTLVSPPSNMVISASGIITWTPAQAQSPSTNTITIIVTNSNPYDLVNQHLSATNSFTVIVKPALILTGPAWITGKQFQFTLNDTTVGVAYTIDYSTNLVNWVSALTFDGPDGPITIIDPNAGTYPHRFYPVKHSP
jgi:hypothetical protein